MSATAAHRYGTHARPTPFPQLGGGLPGLGHLIAFQRNPVALLTQGWRAHGDAFEFKIAGKRFVLLAGPEAHDAYFRAPEDLLSAKEVYQFTVPIFGAGVAYDAPAALMAQQLGFLYPALTDAGMRDHARVMSHEASAWLNDCGTHGEMELCSAFNDLTVKIACRCLLGREMRAELSAGFAALYADLQGGINTLGFFAPRLPTPRHRRRDRARCEVVGLMSRILANRRQQRIAESDLMQTLMQARYRDGRALSDDEISGVLLTVLFAGQHTSGVLATWGLVELLSHPDYLAEVRDEIEAVYGNGQPLTLDTLKSQIKLERAVREAERLHPPLIMLIRKALRDFTFADRLAPAGSMVMVSPALSHRLPGVFTQPHRYEPARFAPPREEHKRHRHALIGFGGGKHRCMGMHFAYLQIKVIWTLLLKHFELELVDPFPRPDYRSWVTGPRRPCRVRYERRDAGGARAT